MTSGPSEFSAASPARKKALLAFLTLLLAGTFAGRQISSWPARLRYPGEIAFIEGMRLAEMVHLREGVRIYNPASAFQFDAAIYGPLYYLLGARLVDPRAPAYLPLRLLSMLGTIGLATACGLLAYLLSRSWIAAFLGPSIFLSSGFVTFFGVSSCADSVALLLVLTGTLVAYRHQDSPALLLSVPLMLLGLFYKQLFVAGPLAVFIYLILERRQRLAAVFAGCIALGAVGLLALFQFVVFPGQAFLRHFTIYNLLPFSAAQFGAGIVFFVVTVAVPALQAFKFINAHRNRFLFCYLTTSTVVALLIGGKEGSASNYFIESLLIASTLFAALFVERMSEASRTRELLLLLVITVFAGQLLVPGAPRLSDFEHDREIQAYLRGTFPPGTPTLGLYTGDLLRAGLETPISDLFQHVQLIRKGTLPEGDLVAAVKGRQFKVIILTFDLQARNDEGCFRRDLTEQLADAIAQNYRPGVTLELPRPEKFHSDDRFYAWVPRPD